jgi:hypothetical protein
VQYLGDRHEPFAARSGTRCRHRACSCDRRECRAARSTRAHHARVWRGRDAVRNYRGGHGQGTPYRWRVAGPDGTITESDEDAPTYSRLWLAVPEISLLPTASSFLPVKSPPGQGQRLEGTFPRALWLGAAGRVRLDAMTNDGRTFAEEAALPDIAEFAHPRALRILKQ